MDNLKLPIKSPYHFINIENILGPISLTEHKGLGKHIYIFGDEHAIKEGCNRVQKNIKIDNYISQIIRYNNDKVIDIFLEVPYINKTETQDYIYTPEQGYLFNDTVSKFYNCMNVLKSSCKYGNARFHYVDIRFSSYKFYSDLLFFDEYMNKIEEIFNKIEDSAEAKKLNDKKLEKYLDNIFINLKKIYVKDLWFNFENAVKNTKLAKQIANISNAKIKEHFTKKLYELQIETKKINNIVDNVRSIFFDFNSDSYTNSLIKDINKVYKLQDKFHEYNERILDYDSAFMDLYLLARIFRSFKRKHGIYSEDPKYILIYTGNLHADNYRGFFNKLGLKQVNSTYNDEQCIDISTFKRPFFR